MSIVVFSIPTQYFLSNPMGSIMNQEKLKQWYPNLSEKDLHMMARCKTPETVMPPDRKSVV